MKILMVCLGNICRSPIAEGILRQKLKKEGRTDVITDSAGTSAFHVGEAPDRRMRATAKDNGVDIDDLRARQFTVADFDQFDLIYAMDHSNYQNILSLARTTQDREKVKMILNETEQVSESEVPDPYYGGDEGFQQVFDMLDIATEAILSKYVR